MPAAISPAPFLNNSLQARNALASRLLFLPTDLKISDFLVLFEYIDLSVDSVWGSLYGLKGLENRWWIQDHGHW